ncbi:Hypothetical predicted protein [Cloeon dipterum]|uniref:Uncharacterized protein n=1 Tax=Cloeon dipterum TaxID=197152 RepID=A0A8S1BX56_9INSE|nr:Hypothetical predicted protein [Cloeon dipterum]
MQRQVVTRTVRITSESSESDAGKANTWQSRVAMWNMQDQEPEVSEQSDQDNKIDEDDSVFDANVEEQKKIMSGEDSCPPENDAAEEPVVPPSQQTRRHDSSESSLFSPPLTPRYLVDLFIPRKRGRPMQRQVVTRTVRITSESSESDAGKANTWQSRVAMWNVQDQEPEVSEQSDQDNKVDEDDSVFDANVEEQKKIMSGEDSCSAENDAAEEPVVPPSQQTRRHDSSESSLFSPPQAMEDQESAKSSQNFIYHGQSPKISSLGSSEIDAAVEPLQPGKMAPPGQQTRRHDSFESSLFSPPLTPRYLVGQPIRRNTLDSSFPSPFSSSDLSIPRQRGQPMQRQVVSNTGRGIRIESDVENADTWQSRVEMWNILPFMQDQESELHPVSKLVATLLLPVHFNTPVAKSEASTLPSARNQQSERGPGESYRK